MIESNNPEIDVNALMAQVRIEAERIRTLSPQRRSSPDGAVSETLPKLLSLRPPPKVGSFESLHPQRLKPLHDLLERARQATEVSKGIPKFLRQLFRKQGRYNSLLIQSVIPLFETLDRLLQWQEQLVSELEAQARWLNDLNHVYSSQLSWNRAAAKLIALIPQLATIDRRFEKENESRTKLQQNVQSLEERQISDAAFIKAELSLHSHVVHKLLGQLSRSQGTAKKSDPKMAEIRSHQLDAFYFSFENRFRGKRDEIKRRQRFYLPFVEQCQAGTTERPIVDLGCGRGEWLELLRERDLSAIGIDLNQVMIAECTERNLRVVQADALEYLQQLPANSQGAVTGFHIIEHLPFTIVLDLIRDALRVLQPGGIVIFESPNCKSLNVGASNFYIDPTHRNPVYPDTAQFLLQSLGFERVTVEYLAPADTSNLDTVEQLPDQVRDLLYGPQDFGVVGYKPGGT